ncbi:RND family efflux transporter MFP subunit [Xanthomonas sp. JAI131]|uniref:efflux RND transporter periplasmic adaptor subunit n=1 Tax=Xanthomonas sp. JAI131 TaxID=2723067 RepID=UPI00179F829B|nr:efflux RND transporter periplasmic adaptor subunit [Xanthomonas sp. JAI131]NYF19487.1 RND family efflux transporter MFP subunit [Xanthomonas sp. JAI131]
MKPSLAMFLCVCVPLAAVALTACSRDPTPPAEAPRAVKLEAVGSSAGTDDRLVAQVRQEQRAELGFEGGGRIASVAVDVGDSVRQGQVLARLDPEPIRLRAEQAEANVRIAAADLQQQQTQLAQQQAMFEDGAASATTLTAAKTAFASAQARVRSAQSDLALARRGLRQAELRAPFDGSVVARLQQPDANVAAGQPVLQLEGRGRAQVTVALPSALAATLHPGQAATAYRAGAPEQALPLRLRSVSDRLDGGATVQALFESAADPAAGLRSGENLLLALPHAETQPLSVPLSALVPSMGNGKPMVFVYQDSNASVRRRQIVTGNAEGDRVQVRQGLRAGERIVAAGAAFLSDGQTVVPFHPATRLTGTASP